MTIELEDYIEEHISEEPPYLKKIDRETNLRHLNGRMCSGHIQGRLLKMLVTMIKPVKVLELGTFTGYSALCMAEGLEEGAMIDTVEADDELEGSILDNFEKSPHGKKINLHISKALDWMWKRPDREYDLILIDADKRQYPDYLKEAMRLLKPGGYIIADNTLWDGHVTEKCRHSDQTAGIMKFNDLAKALDDAEVAIIPMRDGLTLIRKHLSEPMP